MFDLEELVYRSLWSGIAAAGFAILFNVSKRSLLAIFILGGICGLLKSIALNHQMSVVQASWIASMGVGVLCVPICRGLNVPAFSIAFPSVISMIPGYFAYRGLMSVVELSNEHIPNKIEVLMSAVDNGLKVFFILTGLAVGVTIPIIVYRSELFKKYYKDAV